MRCRTGSLSRYLCRTYKVAMLSQSMIGAETGVKTIAAVHGQCRLWVISGQTAAPSILTVVRFGPKADSCTATKPGRSGACSGGRAKKLRFDAGAHGVAQLDSQIDLGERRDAVSVEIVPHAALHRQRRCHVAAGSIRRKARDNLQFAHFTSTISIQLAPFPTG